MSGCNVESAAMADGSAALTVMVSGETTAAFGSLNVAKFSTARLPELLSMRESESFSWIVSVSARFSKA